MAFKQALRKELGVPKTFEDLLKAYHRFEDDRIKKAQKLTGKMDIKPDSFERFMASRCEVCPHSLITSLTLYWLETVSLFDGEMSMTLPAPACETPALFFDCLATVRGARRRASDEEKKE